MTSITPLSPARPEALARARPATASGQFAAALAGPSAGVVAAPIGLAALSPALLGLQAEADGRDEPARRRARALLAGLTRLQLALLGGAEPSLDSLRELGRQAAELPEAAHPQLASVLRGLAVRVEVELARRLPA